MLVSVIIPTFNRSKLVLRAINSVLDQTYREIEVIIVDDGSTDDTTEVLSRIVDGRVTFYKIPNSGAPAARNYGLEKSKGDYITFLDSDDEYYSEKIERQLEVFRSSKVPNLGVVSCGRHDFRNGNLYFEWIPRYRGNVLQHLLKKKRVGAGTPFLMIKREVFERGIMFDPDMPAGQDFDFLVRICMNFGFDFAPYHLVKVNHHDGERVYNPERALRATELQLNKYRDVIAADKAIYESFVLKYADLAFSYGRVDKARAILHNEQLPWTLRKIIWSTYFSTFRSPEKSKLSLTLLKVLRKLL